MHGLWMVRQLHLYDGLVEQHPPRRTHPVTPWPMRNQMLTV